jgi:hypothetical protein
VPEETRNNSRFYSEIVERLNGVRRKENRLSLLYGLLATILLTISLALLSVIIEQIFSFGTFGRTLLFVVTGIVMVCSAGWFIVRPLLRALGMLKSDPNPAIASKVGKHFPSIHDRLLDALQMYEGRENLKRMYSIDLIDASFSDLYELIRPIDFTEAVHNYRVRKMGKIVSYAFAVAVLVFVISPSGFFGSLYRIVHYSQSFASPLPIQFVIEPGNTEVVRGENVPITIHAEGKPIQTISLLTRQHGQVDFDAQALKMQDGVFRTAINNIKASTEYYASAGDVKSDKFNINVLDRPLIRSLQLKVFPPAYTKLPSKILDENTGDISAYPGTKVEIQLMASKELASAAMVFNDSTTLPFIVSGAHADGGFIVKKNRTYHVLLTDAGGLHNLDPVEYTIKIISDEFPTAEILTPGKNIDLAQSMKLDLFIRIKDDFGFSKLRLAYRLAQSRYEQPVEEFSFTDIPLVRNDQSPMDLIYSWDVSSMHLVPEDAVAYYVEVFDNDNINGPKSGKSDTYIVRLPSLEEVLSDVSQSHEQSIESMKSVANDTKQFKQDIESLQQEMKKNREKMDWQQQKKAEEMVQRYESMKKKLEDASRKMDEMMKQMEDNKLLSNQTMEKYLELQKLMDQLKSPDLQEALKKLQESMKKLSPEQLKQAMQQLKFSEEQFRQSLERTLELLKRIHIEQKIDELIKRTEEMMKQQEGLQQQASESKPSDQQKRDELSKQQQDMQKQEGNLEKETSDLEKKMEEFSKEMPMEEMSKAEKQLQEQQLQQQMQKSSSQMQSGDMQGAQKSQQKTTDALNQYKQQMQKVQKSLQEKQMKEVVNQMKKQLENVLELSKREESQKDETGSLDPNSQRFRESAQEQMETMTDLSNVANAMSEIAKKTFAVGPEMGKEIGNAMKQMNEAMQNMEGRNPGGASQKQGEAMGSLNRSAMMMQDALNGMMQGGQPGMGMAGLMGRLGQMAAGQSGINGATAQAMGNGQGQGQGLSSQQQADYQRLGGQQAALQKSLQELSNEAKNAGEFSKLLGDLDHIAQEMQEVQTDLEQGNVNPNTINKQEKILSRLLDSQRSMRERDYEKRRKAETGKNIQRVSPADVDVSTQEGKNKLRQELLKVLEGKYSKDYEELIKKYFEQLEKEDVKQQ